MLALAYTNVPSIPTANPWLLDLGENPHQTIDSLNIDQHIPYHGNDNVTVSNDDSLSILKHSYSKLHMHDHSFNVSNILHTPHVSNNLLSVYCLSLIMI